MSYLLIGYTLDSKFSPFPGHSPPDSLPNQIAVGLVVRVLYYHYVFVRQVQNSIFRQEVYTVQIQILKEKGEEQ